MDFRQKYDVVLEKMDKAAQKSGRSLKDVILVAVTKKVSVEKILEAQNAGLKIFGENKIQEAVSKVPQVPGAEWHMIGSLQTNKIKTALSLFHLIQSVDSLRLAQKINDEARAEGKTANVLLEINISREPQKHGFSADAIYSAMDEMALLPNLKIMGLMGMGPYPVDPDKTRAAFKTLRSCFSVCKGLKLPNMEMRYLSMGMSEDYEIAIEEGSNMLRLGRALFQ